MTWSCYCWRDLFCENPRQPSPST